MLTQDENSDLFEKGNLGDVNLQNLAPFFERLPADPYADADLRLRSRRYSRYKFIDGKLDHRAMKDFMQSSEINDYLGDVERTYEELEPEIEQNETFKRMFAEFQARTDLEEDATIEVHQIRFHVGQRVKEAAPEGNHQDGFNYIAIFVAGSYNHTGGELMLLHGKNDDPFVKEVFNPGEFLVLNDKKLFHNAAPLIPTENEEDGHWDIFVLTANKTTD